MEKNGVILKIKPHHFLDFLYDLAINNRHDEANPTGNRNGELCRDFIDGKLNRIVFTPFVDDICAPCNQLKENRCIQSFDEETTNRYGFRFKNDFNFDLDLKLNKALPSIFVFDKEQKMIDVLLLLQKHLTEETINLYLWNRPNRTENTFIGIQKAIKIYKE